MKILAAITLFLSFAGPVHAASSPFADSLVVKARAAVVNGRFGLAVVLLRGAHELTHDANTLRLLAQSQTIAGQWAEAIENYEVVLTKRPPPKIAKQIRAEVARLKRAPAPFSDELLVHARATPEARKAFGLGMSLVRRGKHSAALPLLRCALVLDPVMPGTYRILGATYGKLKDPRKERAFLLDYLRLRPDGAIANKVRKRLKPTGTLSRVEIGASFPCRIWVNGRDMNLRTPQKELLFAPGSHTVSFVHRGYHIVRNMRVRFRTGKKQKISFSFGVLKTTLDPWARIRANGRDLGLWGAIGLPLGTYELSLTAYDNSKTRDVTVEIKPGKLTTLKW